MEGEDGKFEYQISTDETKSWFDSVRACKVNNSPVPDLTLFSIRERYKSLRVNIGLAG